MGCDCELGLAFAFWCVSGEHVPHLANECLLDLSVQMHFRFFDKDHLAQRTVVFGREPLPIKMIDLNGHEHQVLETQSVIGLG